MFWTKNRSGQSRRDDGHLVDLLGVAAAGQVVDGRVQTLQDRAVGRKAAQTLRDLIADVAGLDAREDEGVGVTRDRGAGELQLADDRGNGGVKLHLAVDLQLGRELLGDDGGVMAERDRAALAGALGGEAQHGDLRIHAEDLGSLGGLDGDLVAFFDGQDARHGADDAAQTPAADETDLTQIECTLDFPSWQATEPGFAEFWEYAIGKFNETYPKVTINLYQVPFDNYIDTLTTMYAAKNPPAITHLPSANFNQFQDMGWFENLDSYFAQTDIPETWTKMQDCMQVDGSNYGLLLLGNAYSLFYNEAMLNEAGVSVPTTPEELLDEARRISGE